MKWNKNHIDVDYAITCSNLIDPIMSFIVGCSPESDHMPITTSVNMRINNTFVAHDRISMETFFPDKYRWRDDCKDTFIRIVNDVITEIGNYFDYVDDVNACVDKLCNVLCFAGKSMKCNRKPRAVVMNKSKPWFDDHCKCLNHDKRLALRIFRNSNSQIDLENYLSKKRLFKLTCKHKKRSYFRDQDRRIQDAIRSNLDIGKFCQN